MMKILVAIMVFTFMMDEPGALLYDAPFAWKDNPELFKMARLLAHFSFVQTPMCRMSFANGQCKNFDSLVLRKPVGGHSVQTCLFDCERNVECVGIGMMKKEKTNMFGGNSAKDVLCVLLKNDKKGRPCEIEREENQKKGYFMDYYSLAYNRGCRTRGSDALRRTTEYKDLQEFNEDPFWITAAHTDTDNPTLECSNSGSIKESWEC